MDEYVIQELVLGLNSIYGNILVRIILYGSVAKNTSTAESDIDIAIILNASSTKEHEETLLDFIVDMNLKYNKVFSIIDIDLSEFKKWENTLPFFINVKKEGVVLWTAA